MLEADQSRRHTAFEAASSGRVRFTEEEKARWTNFVHATWQAIGPDADRVISRRGRRRIGEIIEMTLDANRMQMYSDITPEEEGVLCGFYWSGHRKVKEWLRKELNY